MGEGPGTRVPALPPNPYPNPLRDWGEVYMCSRLMKKRAIIPIVLFLYWLSLPISLAASDDRRDGNWWRQQTQIVKLVYVVGFFDGMELGNKFSYWKFTKDDEFLGKVMASYSEYNQKYFSNVTSGQIVDGLNELYNDFKNRRILVHDAVWLVANGIAGTPEGKLKEMIENWRKNVR